jgi:hypothetical protein
LSFSIEFNKLSESDQDRVSLMLGTFTAPASLPVEQGAVFQTVSSSVKTTIDHQSTEKELTVSVSGAHDRADFIVYGIAGANHFISSIVVKSGHSVAEYERPYEASVLEKWMNGQVIPQKTHVLTHTASEHEQTWNIKLNFEDSTVPDGSEMYAFLVATRTVI